MISKNVMGSLSFDLEKVSIFVNGGIPLGTMFFGFLGYKFNFNFHFVTVTFFLLTLINFYYLYIQRGHTLLANFGLVAQLRYLIESVGPEFRQYLFLSDTEEKPFDRIDRSEVYRKAKGVDAYSSFGSQLLFNRSEIKLRHSMYPIAKTELIPFSLVFGEERGIKNTYELKHPIIISAMSFGALGERAVRSLARGAKKAGIPMNTGEGGFPKYHLLEDCDLIFQIGTAKFGVRNEDGTLNEEKLYEISAKKQVKIIEIKLSQGAKPGKGGVLPKEKITLEISQLRGIPLGQDIISPAFHSECRTAELTIQFIKRIQDISQLPVGIKLCLGNVQEFRELVHEMKKQNIFPDYISIDGAEGGTGAAPKSFMDDLGIPIFKALPLVQEILKSAGVRDKLKLLAAGKLIDPGRQFIAYSMGADTIYTARGFMLALGCIQALQCNQNTCPVGITTHNNNLQNGLAIEQKSVRVENYVKSLAHEHEDLLASLGKRSINELSRKNLYQEGSY